MLDTDRDTALEELRCRLGVREGTEAAERLRAAADDLLEETAEGLNGPGRGPAAAGHDHSYSFLYRNLRNASTGK